MGEQVIDLRQHGIEPLPLNDGECSLESIYYADERGALWIASITPMPDGTATAKRFVQVRPSSKQRRPDHYVCMHCMGQWREVNDAVEHNGVSS